MQRNLTAGLLDAPLCKRLDRKIKEYGVIKKFAQYGRRGWLVLRCARAGGAGDPKGGWAWVVGCVGASLLAFAQ